MAKQSSVNLDITNNVDGFDISGGTTSRTLSVTGGSVTLSGSGSATVTFPTTSTTIAGLGITQSFSALQSFSAGISAAGATFSGNISAPNIVNSFNGITGAVTGVASIRGLTGTVGITNGNGIGLSVSGQTMTFSNTGVLNINGSTGAITNVARTNVDNNFSVAQTIDGAGAYLEIVSGAGGFNLNPGVGIVVSDSFNQPQTLQFAQTGTTTTVTLPSYTTTLAGLSGNQTFTALNTFNAGISAAGGTFGRFVTIDNIPFGAGGTASYTPTNQYGYGDDNRTNLAIGRGALSSNISQITFSPSFIIRGILNTAIGSEALANLSGVTGTISSASSNTALGSSSLSQLKIGAYNLGIGTNSLSGLTAGDYNIGIGFGAGTLAFASGNTAASALNNGIYIGASTRASSPTASGEIVIGSEAVGLGNNTTVIGLISQTSATIYGLVNTPSGISAAGGVTFSGTFSGTTGSFSRLLTASAGITTSFIYASTGSTFGARVDVAGILDVVGGVTLESTLDVVGVSRFAGGVTFAGTLQGATASFNRLVSFTAGLSGTGITLSGNLSAATKSFVIPHPTKPHMTLQHGSLEGPENGVYVRGRLTDTDTIPLPEYWHGLVDSSTITASLTEIGNCNHHWIAAVEGYTVTVNSESGAIDCFYTVWGERKDVGKMPVEY
jgi:hypothetical protein